MKPDPIRGWAQQYDEALGTGPSDRALASQRARLLFAYQRDQKRSPSRLFLWVPALAALTVAFFFYFKTTTPSVETVVIANAPLEVGGRVVTSVASSKLEFSGGSVANVAPHSQLTLEENTAERIRTRILAGKVSFDVQRKAGRQWTIFAGENQVRVLGTAFTVEYGEKDGSFSVEVSRGRVEVRPVGAPRLYLSAGERFSVAPQKSFTEPPPPAQAASAPALELPESAASQVKSPAHRSSNRASWSELVRQGKYEEALNAVRATGVDNVIEHSPAADLILLGNAARFRSDFGLAERAYRHVRNGTDGGSRPLAAYYLARIETDAHKNQGEAIHWLKTYLSESPRGELSSSARGRLMDLLSRTGDRNGALTVAREYLRLHPGGTDEALARRLIQGNVASPK